MGRPAVTFHARAPVRIDFAGGWSDVPDFADVHTGGGAVVNAAISLYVRVECTPGGGKFRLHAEDLGERVFLQTPADIVYDGKLDLHKAALNMLPVAGGVEIISSSDVPAGSGLGASGALDVALLQALALCRRERFDPVDLAGMGFHLETGELKMAGGRQDQYGAALGGFHTFSFGSGDVDVRTLDVTPEAAEDLAGHMAIVYTGQSHFSSQTHDRVWKAYHANQQGVGEAIAVMRDLVGPLSYSLERGDWRGVARALDENWVQQQRLDATISTPATREIETAVREVGAWAVKAAGAGAGGCLIVMGPADRQLEIRRAAEAQGVGGGGSRWGRGRTLDWWFDFAGVTSWETGGDAGNRPG